MSRELALPKAPYVVLPAPAAVLHGKRVEYSEINAGRGPFGSVGELRVGKANSQGKHPVHIVFAIDREGRPVEHAIALQQEHIDTLQALDFNKAAAHFRCGRTIRS